MQSDSFVARKYRIAAFPVLKLPFIDTHTSLVFIFANQSDLSLLPLILTITTVLFQRIEELYLSRQQIKTCQSKSESLQLFHARQLVVVDLCLMFLRWCEHGICTSRIALARKYRHIYLVHK